MKRNKATDRKVWIGIDDEPDSSFAFDTDDSFKNTPIYHRIRMLKNEVESESLGYEDEIEECEIINCGII